MKWNAKALIVVLIVLSLSYFLTSSQDEKLSNKIKEKKIKSCGEQKILDCDLIELYHDDCFKKSYRSTYKVKQFHQAEYDRCMDVNMKQTSKGTPLTNDS